MNAPLIAPMLVARLLGVAECTLLNWENGATEPAVRYLPRIIGFLGYSPLEPPQSRGEHIRKRREEVGLSQKRLAAQLGIDEGTLARWEKGLYNPWSVLPYRSH